MATEESEEQPVLPMGSAYELALWAAHDVMVRQLALKLRVTSQQMSHRHTNLE